SSAALPPRPQHGSSRGRLPGSGRTRPPDHRVRPPARLEMAAAVGSRQTHRSEGAGRIAMTRPAKPGSLSFVELALIAGILVVVGYLLIVAIWLRVDYF